MTMQNQILLFFIALICVGVINYNTHTTNNNDSPLFYIRGKTKTTFKLIEYEQICNMKGAINNFKASKYFDISASAYDYRILIGCGDRGPIRQLVENELKKSDPKPLIVYWVGDTDWWPRGRCDGGHMFFVTSIDRSKSGRIGRGTIPGGDCKWYQLPYTAGGKRTIKPNPKYLMSFVGSVGTYNKRKWLARLLEGNDDVKILFNTWWGQETTAVERKHYAEEFNSIMSDSTFTLCPRGVGYSSIRLLLSIIHGSIPILLDDFINPFEDGALDKFAIRWSMDDLSNLRQHLLKQNITKLREEMDKFLERWYDDVKLDDRYDHTTFINNVINLS